MSILCLASVDAAKQGCAGFGGRCKAVAGGSLGGGVSGEGYNVLAAIGRSDGILRRRSSTGHVSHGITVDLN